MPIYNAHGIKRGMVTFTHDLETNTVNASAEYELTDEDGNVIERFGVMSHGVEIAWDAMSEAQKAALADLEGVIDLSIQVREGLV